MDYLHYEFDAQVGDIAEVTLDAAANVQLMDTTNYNNYRNGQTFRYHGGYVKHTPFRLPFPHSGHWHLVIDLGGGSGRVRATARVIPAAVGVTV